MKFTAGYILGGATVIGMGVSFCAGVLACDWAYSKKNEAAVKVSDASVSKALFDYLKTKNN